MRQVTIVCYVSGHGFGHAVRTTEVLRVLRRKRPDVRLLVRSAAPPWLFAPIGEHEYHSCRLDVGVVQRDSLTLDIEASLRSARALVERQQDLIDTEAAALSSYRPDLVFADIPAAAFDVAARLKVPAVGMANFSWDWIYADYVETLPEYADVVADLRRAYGRATLLLQLPLHGDLSAFPQRRDIPLVARRPQLAAAETRRRLELPASQRLVLLSFGGFGLDLRRAPEIPGVAYIATESATGGAPPDSAMHFVRNAALAAAGVRYEDLVAASDVVFTKPGYGIVSDCIAAGTSMIYTERGRFAEYAVLVDGIRTHLPSAHMSNADLHAGRWTNAIEEALSQPRRTPAIRTDGAEAAAEVLLQLAE